MIKGFKLHGYLSHEDTLLTGIPKGIIQVLGENGSGKSSLVESVMYALYGRTRNDTSKAIMGVGQTAVIYDDHVFYRGKLVKVQKGSEVVAKGSKQVKDYVEDLIGVDQFLFSQASYFGNGISDQIVSSAPTKRLELLQALLPALRVYQKAESLAGDNASKWIDKESHYNSVLGYAKNQASDFNLSEARSRLSVLTTTKAQLEKNILEMSKQVRSNDEDVARLKRLDDITTRHADRSNSMPKDVRDEKDRYTAILTAVKADLTVYEACLDHSHEDATCPFCSSIISEKSMKGIRTIYAKRKLEFTKTSERIARLKKNVREYEVADRELQALEAQLDEIEFDKEDIIDIVGNIMRAVSKRTSSQKKLDSHQANLARVTKEYLILKSDISKHKKQVTDVEGIKAKLKVARSRVDDYRSVQYVFSKRGIPYELLKDVVATLKTRATTIYNTITSHQAQIEIDFVTISNQAAVEYNLKKSGGKVVPFSTLSTGQRTLYVFAVRLALSELLTAKMGFKPSFLVLDEVTSNLSTEVRERFANYLRQLTQRYEQIFVTSHTSLPAVQDFTINCELRGEVSYVTKG